MQNLKSYDMNDVLTLAPSNEMYSTPISIETNPSYGMRRNENLVQSEVIQGSRQNVSNRGQSINIRLIVVLIIAILLFLSISLVSIALSITSYSRQSEILSQLNNANSDAVQLTRCNISSNVLQAITELDPRIICSNETQKHCGPGLWWQVASLNMSDPSQQCPSAWREYNTSSGIRACGRPFNLEGSCAVTDYSLIGRQYSRVCGRLIGYQIGSPDAFIGSGTRLIREVIIFDGISITYGAQQSHIWSYLAGRQEMGGNPLFQCPCSEENAPTPPQFIGDNYFCESGNPTDSADDNHFFSNDPLWDGQQCEGTCCNGTNSPPWFSVQLPAPTTDMIEVSICLNQGTADEDTPIELLEIYVQ